LDQKGKKYNHFAVDGAERMRQMIKSLLNYSRVGSDKMELQEISTEKIVKDVLKLNRSAIENQGAEISYNNLPKDRASYFSIFQLFYNFINNAIKYHKEDEKPVAAIIGLEVE
jgi:light-regulated signal transduction histidine kinase (bacteriophytochrome)